LKRKELDFYNNMIGVKIVPIPLIHQLIRLLDMPCEPFGIIEGRGLNVGVQFILDLCNLSRLIARSTAIFSYSSAE
jgi:hypothetical protein